MPATPLWKNAVEYMKVDKAGEIGLGKTYELLDYLLTAHAGERLQIKRVVDYVCMIRDLVSQLESAADWAKLSKEYGLAQAAAAAAAAPKEPEAEIEVEVEETPAPVVFSAPVPVPVPASTPTPARRWSAPPPVPTWKVEQQQRDLAAGVSVTFKDGDQAAIVWCEGGRRAIVGNARSKENVTSAVARALKMEVDEQGRVILGSGQSSKLDFIQALVTEFPIDGNINAVER